MPKVVINGFGRIGRPVLKNILANHKDLEIVAINDLGGSKPLAHLLKYDSNYGIYEKDVKSDDDGIIIDGKKIKLFQQKDIMNLPWRDLEIDIVIECTGAYKNSEDLNKHLESGAKKVVVSVPIQDAKVPTYLMGINIDKYEPSKDHVISMASCTTNGLAPLVRVIHENFKIKNGVFTTVHSYTNDQRILDLPHKDLRRARAAALNIIPTTTGAAIAIEKAFPELKSLLNGTAIRVPTSTVSIVDFTAIVVKNTTADEINSVMKEASQNELKGILDVCDQPLVSSDFKGNSNSSILDSALTMANDNLVKVTAWYDNEWAYSMRLAELVNLIANKL